MPEDSRKVLSVRDMLSPGNILEYELAGGSASEQRALDFLNNPHGYVITPPRYAATVMLLSTGKPHRSHRVSLVTSDARDDEVIAPGPVDVYMLKRASTMEFVPDAVVFPGGGMDERDVSCVIEHTGRSFKEWGARMEVPEGIARGVVVAAARELFEESGILLAGKDGHSIVQDEQGDHWKADRDRVATREISFGEYFLEKGLVLRDDLLHLRGHWITPPYEKRRYDTYFFAARLPHGQHADGMTSEAVASGWIAPQEAIKLFDEGKLLLMPPTIANLSMLGRAESVEEALTSPFYGHIKPNAAQDERGIYLRSEIR